MSELQTEYDTPWKDAIESYFEEFIAFFFRRLMGISIGHRAMNFSTKNCNKLCGMQN
jgi:hypothetical protein